MEDRTHSIYNQKRSIPIFSINYDFVPSSTYREKMLWVVTDFVPQDLKVGQFVRLVSDNGHLQFPHEYLQIEDIEGKRIVLSSKLVPRRIIRAGGNLRYYTTLSEGKGLSTQWNPLSHGGQWGYATRDWDNLPGIYRNWQYGYGRAIATLHY
jgi:hypothetical protein